MSGAVVGTREASGQSTASSNGRLVAMRLAARPGRVEGIGDTAGGGSGGAAALEPDDVRVAGRQPPGLDRQRLDRDAADVAGMGAPAGAVGAGRADLAVAGAVVAVALQQEEREVATAGELGGEGVLVRAVGHPMSFRSAPLSGLSKSRHLVTV